jgi:hypothetical protein
MKRQSGGTLKTAPIKKIYLIFYSEPLPLINNNKMASQYKNSE